MLLLLLAITQSLLLTMGQVLLKYGLMRMLPFAWTAAFWRSALLNVPFAMSGLSFAAASLLWMYIIKHFPLSTAYPMVSLSYVFGLIAAAVFFHEQTDWTKWAGVALIITGCIIIAR